MFSAEPVESEGQAQPSWFASPPLPVRCAEILLLAVALPAGALWFATPATIQFLLPLLIIVPLLLGLRYGFVGGAAAALCVGLVLLYIAIQRPLILPQYPKPLAITLLACGVIAGQFRDRFAGSLRHSHAQARYHAHRFARFGNAYGVLQASHARLERQLVDTGLNMRGALTQIRQALPIEPVPAHVRLLGMAEPVLDLLAQTGSLHAASLYALGAHGKPESRPLARIGKGADLAADDVMLREALRTRELIGARPGDLRGAGAPDDADNALAQDGAGGTGGPAGAGTGTVGHIAILPLVDSRGHVHAVLCVDAMPFVAIRQSVFNALAMVAREIADMLSGWHGILAVKHDPAALLRSLAQKLAVAREAGLQTTLTAVCIRPAPAPRAASGPVAGRTDQERVVRRSLAQGRALDQAWLCEDRQGNAVIVKLLTMTPIDAARSHLARLTALGQAEGLAVDTFAWTLSSRQRPTELLQLLARSCDLAYAGPRPDARADVEADARTDTRPEVRTNARPDARPEVRSDARSQTRQAADQVAPAGDIWQDPARVRAAGAARFVEQSS